MFVFGFLMFWLMKVKTLEQTTAAQELNKQRIARVTKFSETLNTAPTESAVLHWAQVSLSPSLVPRVEQPNRQ